MKGGRWYSLVDKVDAERTLAAAWERVKRNSGSAGVDRQSVQAFGARAETYLAELAGALRAGTYRPESVRRVWIPKPGRAERRPLGIPTVKDRIVQTALKLVVEPIWEAEFAEQSSGFRPRRGCKDAPRRVQELLDGGATWVVEVDLESYFDRIPHGALVAEVERTIADGGVLRLLRAYLTQGVMDGLERWQPESGTPQGAVISPLLANLYLNPLDWRMAEQGYQVVRYADDLVVLCRSQAEASAVLEELGAWVAAHGLTLHPEKTRIVDATERGGFDFLGYHFERGTRWPSRRSERKLRDTIRAKTRRTTGGSLDQIIAGLNPVVRGWFGYFKHSHWTTFGTLDGWIRMRLRSILRWRRKGKGRGRGADHQRWPNAYFVRHGLFTMQTARLHAVRTLAVQSR
ncbi:MAG: group II intron reverse transcriptase/maturase [Chloroflexota bacterium]